jgi:hypothetical protein
MALIGLCVRPDGDAGGELAIAQIIFVIATKCNRGVGGSWC